MVTTTATSQIVRALSRNHVSTKAVGTARREFSALLTTAEEFPGIPATTPSSASASKASVTTLPNGLTIVSETASSTSTVSITYPNAGSSSESTSEAGAALANKYLAFKSGSGLSAAVILRNIENAGGVPFSTVDKSSATIGYTASKEQAINLVPLIATTCEFAKWDVKEAQASANMIAGEASTNVLSVVSDSIFSAAFGPQSAWGRSTYTPNASSVAIQSFGQKAYGLNGAVLAATGIDDHEAFVKAVEEGLADSFVGDALPSVSSDFLGSEIRVNAPSTGVAHVALAFQGPTDSTPLMSIVESCIELSSTSTSSSVSGFSSSKSGLVGLYGSSTDGGVSVTDELCSIMTTIPSADVITRAKNLAKAKALLSIDGGDSQSLAGFMTTSVLESGSFGYEGVAAAYDAVSVEEVQAVFTALGGSTPAMAAVGDVSAVPYHGSIVTRFSS